MHAAWFLATLLTTSWAAVGTPPGMPWTIGTLFRALPYGLWYSLPILIILGCHEFGHYFYCRRHNVDATLPYFLPAPPFFLTGTFGAVIRIREAFPSKRALFDIGVAGPIAGFVALLPFLYWGITMSTVVPKLPPSAAVIYFGEPLLYKFFAYLHFGALGPGQDVLIHPMAFAAWFGMLATALNLMPFGQLDGGHISYAVLGPRSWMVSLATLITTIVMLIFESMSWLSMAIIMLAMAFFLGIGHPRLVDDHEPLDSTRRLVALGALIIFVVCFTPVPIQTFFSGK
ncbi:MAG TPA: site-2 protease family protein [Vicinamibacterales bacterium]|nr:site-2 protease family protein [Vicinamibacterales bacterium]